MPVAIIKHKKVSTVPDGTDTSLVSPSDWNDTHIVKMYENAIDIPPTSPSEYNDEFDDDVIDSSWSRMGTITTITEEQGSLFLSTAGVANNQRFNGLVKTIPSTGVREFVIKTTNQGAWSSYNGIFMMYRNSVTKYASGLAIIGAMNRGYGALLGLNIRPNETLDGEYTLGGISTQDTCYIKLRLTDTTFSFSMSRDGRKFTPPVWTGGIWGNITPPDQICIGIHADITSNAVGHLHTIDWFRMVKDGIVSGSI